MENHESLYVIVDDLAIVHLPQDWSAHGPAGTGAAEPDIPRQYRRCRLHSVQQAGKLSYGR